RDWSSVVCSSDLRRRRSRSQHWSSDSSSSFIRLRSSGSRPSEVERNACSSSTNSRMVDMMSFSVPLLMRPWSVREDAEARDMTWAYMPWTEGLHGAVATWRGPTASMVWETPGTAGFVVDRSQDGEHPGGIDLHLFTLEYHEGVLLWRLIRDNTKAGPWRRPTVTVMTSRGTSTGCAVSRVRSADFSAWSRTTSTASTSSRRPLRSTRPCAPSPCRCSTSTSSTVWPTRSPTGVKRPTRRSERPPTPSPVWSVPEPVPAPPHCRRHRTGVPLSSHGHTPVFTARKPREDRGHPSGFGVTGLEVVQQAFALTLGTVGLHVLDRRVGRKRRRSSTHLREPQP